MVQEAIVEDVLENIERIQKALMESEFWDITLVIQKKKCGRDWGFLWLSCRWVWENDGKPKHHECDPGRLQPGYYIGKLNVGARECEEQYREKFDFGVKDDGKK